jgi:hypothetical protein
VERLTAGIAQWVDVIRVGWLTVVFQMKDHSLSRLGTLLLHATDATSRKLRWASIGEFLILDSIAKAPVFV